MWLKLKQFVMALLLVNSIASANDVAQLDGDWYSYKWKYGYSLSQGKGVAFATNSPNFKVGQEIVRLTSVGDNAFVGENIYKDGKFYKIKATLQSDGKLVFEDEKNVKWEMERIQSSEVKKIKNNFQKKYTQSEQEIEEILLRATKLLSEALDLVNKKDYRLGCKKLKSGLKLWKTIDVKSIPIKNMEQFSRVDSEVRETELISTMVCSLY